MLLFYEILLDGTIIDTDLKCVHATLVVAKTAIGLVRAISYYQNIKMVGLPTAHFYISRPDLLNQGLSSL